MKFNIRLFLERLYSYPTLKFVIAAFLLSIIISVAFRFLFYSFGENDFTLSNPPTVANSSIYYAFIKLVLLTPIIETFLFQTIPYFFIAQFDFLKKRNWIVILISAIAFGMSHYYSLWYILHSGILGALFMYFYIVRRKMADSFLAISIIHTLRNLMAFTIEIFIN